jgi:hypothetical protein
MPTRKKPTKPKTPRAKNALEITVEFPRGQKTPDLLEAIKAALDAKEVTEAINSRETIIVRSETEGNRPQPRKALKKV